MNVIFHTLISNSICDAITIVFHGPKIKYKLEQIMKQIPSSSDWQSIFYILQYKDVGYRKRSTKKLITNQIYLYILSARHLTHGIYCFSKPQMDAYNVHTPKKFFFVKGTQCMNGRNTVLRNSVTHK